MDRSRATLTSGRLRLLSELFAYETKELAKILGAIVCRTRGSKE
jgi:hypothetical protein